MCNEDLPIATQIELLHLRAEDLAAQAKYADGERAGFLLAHAQKLVRKAAELRESLPEDEA